MLKNIVFDMDNTLVDEVGSTLRPGIIDFLVNLKKMDLNLILWTNSSKERAKTILYNHKLNRYFSKFIFREDYDINNEGKCKDIRKVKGDLLIDDDPKEIEFARKNKRKTYLIKSYRKNGITDKNEYNEIMKIINDKSDNILTVFLNEKTTCHITARTCCAQILYENSMLTRRLICL